MRQHIFLTKKSNTRFDKKTNTFIKQLGNITLHIPEEFTTIINQEPVIIFPIKNASLQLIKPNVYKIIKHNYNIFLVYSFRYKCDLSSLLTKPVKEIIPIKFKIKNKTKKLGYFVITKAFEFSIKEGNEYIKYTMFGKEYPQNEKEKEVNSG